jgi:hypothetical protein
VSPKKLGRSLKKVENHMARLCFKAVLGNFLSFALLEYLEASELSHKTFSAFWNIFLSLNALISLA